MDSAQSEILKASLLGKSVGGWEIHDSYGHGKSAVVMAAVRDGQSAAVKIFHPELVERCGRETQLARIRRETSLIGSQHQNLVEILDGGACPDTGHLYVVMEKIPWKNLKEALSDIPENRVRSLIFQVAAAAKYLEGKGIAHRDIKPENIAISDDFEIAKLLDLGVIRPFGVSGLTDANLRPFIGTLRYSSPEFLRRVEEDSPEGWRAVTIYQIGAVLHDLIMKRELFEEFSEPFPVLVEAVLTKRPDVHGKDPDLVRICNHSLVKNPKTRLELVGWRDFAENSQEENTTSALHERIKGRQKYFREIGSDGESGMAVSEGARLLKQQLDVASNTFDAKMTVLLTTLKCFPLRAITPHVDVDKCTIKCVVEFESDDVLGIPHPISMQFELLLLDQNDGQPIYRLSAVASMSVKGEIIEIAKSSSLIAGNLNDVVGDVCIESWLLATLGTTYDLLDQHSPDLT